MLEVVAVLLGAATTAAAGYATAILHYVIFGEVEWLSGF